jgi:hypothetical protein
VTRRDALRLAALGAAAPLAAATASARADAVEDQKKQELAAMAAAVAGEQVTEVAYEAIANSGLLGHAATGAMRVLLDHAKVHADSLGQGMKEQLGKDPPQPPKRTAIHGLAGMRRADDALRLAMGLEQKAIAAHLVAVQKTGNALLLQAIAGVVASDAQHLVLLRQLLRRSPLPSAFERGAP